MTAPRATMRLQFHAGFTFADAQALLPYFAALGVSHLYASPITTARPGSTHGYDTIDPTRINPELGGEQGLRRLVGELRRHEMGLIADIVPNHMAVGSGNAWWMDVLARGRASRYARYFDIDWEPDNPRLRGKVLLPILGRPYGEALAAGEIALRADNAGDAFIEYFDHKFPLAAGTPALREHPSPAAFDPASAGGRERLHHLLEEQHYRLAWWRSANDEINWRRFFDINELVAVRIEDDEVFDAVHAAVFRLYAGGLIDGVRVDHIDGLAQPQEYCAKLQARLRALEHERPSDWPGGRAYFIVEKILAHDERLPQGWETDGTTGYDFMDEVSALQHDAAGEQPLTDLWERLSGRFGDFGREEELARREILQRSFSSQLEGVARAFYQITQGDLATRDIARPAIHRILTEILVHFPVYRIYAGVAHASPPELAFLSQAVAGAKTRCLPSDRWLVEMSGGWLAGARIRPRADAQQTIALARFQQLSASLCAKAVEDTALYRYGRLLSRNDVGFDPRRLSCPSSEFHRRMEERTADFPHSMLATATHDHKRGEDVRARLAVLSEVPGEWAQAAERWIALCLAHCAAANAIPAPSAGDIAMLLQTIVGAWPSGLEPTDLDRLAAYAGRIAAWQQKALREAKLCSDWSAPNESYERAARELVAWVLAGSSELLPEIAAFVRRLAPAGAANGLAQALLKLTVPGVPDIYQGTEYWDFSLVDPDNRSPVDFAARKRSLEAASSAASAAGLAGDWTDGRIKQAMIARVLAVRKEMPRLFADGSYVPLEAVGPLAEHVFAFARILGNSAAVVAISRCCAKLLRDDGSLTIAPARWKDTRILLPHELEGYGFSSVLTGEEIPPIDRAFAVAQILSGLPVALLTDNSR
jgi:(1->4)-alpha-D-glucan 1-alpha-D-glucosylmutase